MSTTTIDTTETYEIIETVGESIKFWQEGPHGAMRISGTRVPIDAVYHHFMHGDTPEQIAASYPGVSLSDIYATIAYILENRDFVEEYLRKGEIRAAEMKAMIEEKFGERNAKFKQRMLARNEERLASLKS
jgi:uncharacterized protein (DUF433 family)